MGRYISIDWGRKLDHTATTYLSREGEYPRWTFTVDEAIRFPLSTPFHAVLTYLQTRATPWPSEPYTLITDASGIGDVLIEDMRREGLRPEGIVITGGGSATKDERDPHIWHVARNILVTTLKQRLGTSLTLRCSTEMAVLIAKEAANMQYSITSALHIQTEPRQGKHDDLLLSVAMGVWFGQNQGPPAAGLTPAEIAEVHRQAGAPLPPEQVALRRVWGDRGRQRYW